MQLLNNLVPHNSRRSEFTITALYFGILLLALFASYMGFNQIAQAEYYTADPLWMEDYLRDLFQRGRNVTDWAMTGLGYFPAMLVYGLIRYGTHNIFLAYVGLGFSYLIFYIFFFYVLLGFLDEYAPQVKLRFAFLCTSIMMLSAFVLRSSPFFYDVQFFTFVNRGSTMVNAAISILLTLIWLKSSKKGYVWILLLLILSILASMTDRIYEIFFLFPAFAAIFILSLIGAVRWRYAMIFGAMVLISDLVSQKIFHLIMPNQMVSYSKITLIDGWIPLIKFHIPFFVDGLYYWAVLLSYLCLAGLTLNILWRIRRYRNESIKSNTLESKLIAKIFLILLAVIALPASFVSMALFNRSGTYNGSANVLVLFFWPFLFMLSSYGRNLMLKSWFNIIVISILGVYLVKIAIYSNTPLVDLIRPVYPYSKIGQCLDDHVDELGDGAGIGDYWIARPINLFSQKGVRVYQAQGSELELFYWNSNREVFDDRKYTFVITNIPTNLQPILERDVLRNQGEPDSRFVCEQYPILVYKSGMRGNRFIQDAKNPK